MRHAATLRALGIPPSLVAARGLEPHANARRLAIAERGADGREHLLVPAAARAWQRMRAAAAGDAVLICIVSAHRSIERQAEIVRAKLSAGQSIEDVLRVSAPPGFSEHHTGRAVDVGTPGVAHLELAFETTLAFSWLQVHAQRFGFVLSYPAGNRHGYQYEPWHWCFTARGRAPAEAARAARPRRG